MNEVHQAVSYSEYQQYTAVIVQACWRYRLQQDDLADVVQQTWAEYARFQNQSVHETAANNPSAWLVRAAKWNALDLVRKRRLERDRFTPIDEDQLDWVVADPVEDALREEQSSLVWDAIGRLSTEAQEIIRLWMIKGLNEAEIAAEIGLPSEEAVRMRLRRYKTKLAGLLRGSIA